MRLLELFSRRGGLALRWSGMPPEPLLLRVLSLDGSLVRELSLPPGSAGQTDLDLPTGPLAVWAEVVSHRGGRVAFSAPVTVNRGDWALDPLLWS